MKNAPHEARKGSTAKKKKSRSSKGGTKKAKSPPSVRRIAATILQTIEESGSRRFASDLIESASERSALSARDRRFLVELVLGVQRTRGTLDSILDAYIHNPGEDISGQVIQNLRLGLYQVLFLDGIPPHAAVSEAVKSVRRPAHLRAFVNGVMRSIVREAKKVDKEKEVPGTSLRKRLELSAHKVCFFPKEVFPDPEKDQTGYLAAAYSHPRRIVMRWLKNFGEEQTQSLMRHNNRRPLTYLRVNSEKGDAETLVHQLHQQEIAAKEGPGKHTITLGSPVSQFLKSTAFRKGMATIQGAFAQKAVPMLDPKTNESVLEIGAAPGGKTTQIAEYRKDQGEHLAVESDPSKAALLESSCRRLQLKSPQVLIADGTKLPLLNKTFDAVLLDVPCSNSAVFSKRPEAKWRFSESSLLELCGIQKGLLNAAAAYVAPGGRLLYGTCSVESEENSEQIDGFLKDHPEFKKVEEELGIPNQERGDGGYICLLQRA